MDSTMEPLDSGISQFKLDEMEMAAQSSETTLNLGSSVVGCAKATAGHVWFITMSSEIKNVKLEVSRYTPRELADMSC
jgi:hypothetical protein